MGSYDKVLSPSVCDALAQNKVQDKARFLIENASFLSLLLSRFFSFTSHRGSTQASMPSLEADLVIGYQVDWKTFLEFAEYNEMEDTFGNMETRMREIAGDLLKVSHHLISANGFI